MSWGFDCLVQFLMYKYVIYVAELFNIISGRPTVLQCIRIKRLLEISMKTERQIDGKEDSKVLCANINEEKI
jgi:hypothetical protein